jgi:site-specific DNA recombinase
VRHECAPYNRLKARTRSRDQARTDANRAWTARDTINQKSITPQTPGTVASTAHKRMRLPGGGCRSDNPRALAQRADVDNAEGRIMASNAAHTAGRG